MSCSRSKKRVFICILIPICLLFFIINIHQVDWSQKIMSQFHVEQPDSTSHRLYLPQAHSYSNAELVKEFSKEVLSIPSRYSTKPDGYAKVKCASYPDFTDIQFENKLWQQWQSRKSDNPAIFHIFGAYWDERISSVRVLLMVNTVKPPKVVCQLWYGDNDDVPYADTSAMALYNYIWAAGDDIGKVGIDLHPFILTCKKSLKSYVPESVSIVDNACDSATNNINVFYAKPETPKTKNIEKLKFAVCVKGFSFYHDDMTLRLVEWLEFLRVFGVGKVIIYDLAINPDISRVLDYYRTTGFVDWLSFTQPGTQLNEPSLVKFYLKNNLPLKRKSEAIPYNDCFYRNRQNFDYIVLLDIDELIVPLQNDTWVDLLENLSNTVSFDAYETTNYYFFDDQEPRSNDELPIYFHMLQHIKRAKKHTKRGWFVKTFFNTKTVVTLQHHRPRSCLTSSLDDGKCNIDTINETKAQLQHYRKDCHPEVAFECNAVYRSNTIIDDNLKRFQEIIVNNVQNVLMDLGILKTP